MKTVPERVFNIVLLGDGGVGKTAITLKFTRNQFIESYDPTIEDSYSKSVDVGGQQVTLDVLDTAGQEEYRSLSDSWIREGKGFLLVYDVTSMSSLERCIEMFNQIKKIKEDDHVVFLVGNKSDCVKRQITVEQGAIIAKDFRVFQLETSAKTGENIEKCFKMMAKQLIKMDLTVERKKKCIVM